MNLQNETFEFISRDKYLNALEIIDNYHKQKQNIKNEIEVVNRSISKSSVGDFVLCENVKDSNKKCLTKNKLYRITRISRERFQIIDDNGVRKSYLFSNIQFLALQ